MKILLINSLLQGGAANSVLSLAEGLAVRGHEPIIITSGETSFIENKNGLKIYQIKTPNLYGVSSTRHQHILKKPIWHLIDSYNLFSKSSLIKILQTEKPDIVHTNNIAGFSPYIWKIARKLKIPVVHTLRDFYLLCSQSILFKNGSNCQKRCSKCWVFSSIKKPLSKHVSAVVGISKHILTTHLDYKFFPNAKIKTHIYNSVNKPVIQLEKGKTSLGKIKFGFVGLLAPIKGIDYLLNIFKTLPSKQAELYIWGKGYTNSYENELITKFNSTNIFFMGHGSHEDIYNTIDVLIAPALWHEPFGRIVIEANSYGIPVIASNRGGLAELIKEGVNGFSFNPDTPDDLFNQLMTFVNFPNLINTLSTQCINMTEDFSSEKISAQYLDLYSQVVK